MLLWTMWNWTGWIGSRSKRSLLIKFKCGEVSCDFVEFVLYYIILFYFIFICVESVLCSGFCFNFCRFKSFLPVLNLHLGKFALVKTKEDLGSVGGSSIATKMLYDRSWSLERRLGAYAFAIPAKSFPINLLSF